MFPLINAAIRDEVERLDRGDVDMISKQYFTASEREVSHQKRYSYGIESKYFMPLNLDRVLTDIPTPVPEPPVSLLEICEISLDPHCEIL